MNEHISQNWINETADNYLYTDNNKVDGSIGDLIDSLDTQKNEIQKQNNVLFATLRKLKESLLDYGDVFELSPIGFFILDRNGIIQRANTQAGFHLGFDKKLLTGRDFANFFPDRMNKSSFFKHREQAIKEQQIFQLECKVSRENGIIFPALVQGSVVKDNLSVFKYMLISLTDITEIKEREYQIETSLYKAERTNEMLSNFMSIASHEFRAPLSTVLFSNALIEKYARLGQSDRMLKHVSRVKSSVKVMVNIIEDFLSLERLESGKVEIINTNFDLLSFCEDLIEEIRPQMRPGQMINYTNTGNLEVISDKKVLQHILINLLSNGCKYSQEHSEIFFTTEANNERISIIIKDTGIGIPKTEQKKIFTRFFRARNAVSINGTGLGLYICKRYVELLNGTISFTSETNNGTTFFVEVSQGVNQTTTTQEGGFSKK